MSKYCVELEPIEYYFLGNERSFGFGRNNKGIYNNYFVISENLPTQTTLLGMMRYFVLKRMNLLNKNFSSQGLTAQQIERQKEFIGRSSFIMSCNDKLEYGVIKKISPMFLKNDKKQILVKTPFNGSFDNNKIKLRGLQKDVCKIMDGSSERDFKLIDKIDLKKEDDYRDSYVLLDDLSVIENSEIFKSHVKVGINRYLDEDGFFKKEYKFFKDYKLCFYVTLDDTKLNLDDKITDVVYLGAEKSAFKLTMYKENDNLEETIKETLKIDDGVYYYALSDLACEDANKLNECCDLIFLETRNFRCLKTNYDKDNFYHKLEQSELYNFIRAGSVFFVNEAREQDFEHLFENENLKNIGFNQIIKIGGNN